MREFGLDDPASLQARRRVFRFATDGPVEVIAGVSGTRDGRARVCIHQGPPEAPRTEPFCVDMRESAVKSTVRRSTDWTVTLIGADAGQAPVTTLSLSFRATSPRVEMRDLRFQGTSLPEYNGVDMEVEARRDGPLEVAGAWRETGGSGTHDWELLLDDLSEPDPEARLTGTGTSVSHTLPAEELHRYRVALRNTAAVVATQVLLDVTLTWP